MKTILALLAAVVLTTGCASKPAGNAVSDYLAAEKTIQGVVLSPEEEEAAIGRFRVFFADIRADRVPELTPALYAPDAFFNDTLKTIRGSEGIAKYFIKTAEHTDFVRAEVVDVARSGTNYYVRWVMDVRFKGGKETIRTIGMTHLRFDKEGRIVLHQDFWDSTTGFFEHAPVIGPVIRWMKSLI